MNRYITINRRWMAKLIFLSKFYHIFLCCYDVSHWKFPFRKWRSLKKKTCCNFFPSSFQICDAPHIKRHGLNAEHSWLVPSLHCHSALYTRCRSQMLNSSTNNHKDHSHPKTIYLIGRCILSIHFTSSLLKPSNLCEHQLLQTWFWYSDAVH